MILFDLAKHEWLKGIRSSGFYKNVTMRYFYEHLFALHWRPVAFYGFFAQ